MLFNKKRLAAVMLLSVMPVSQIVQAIPFTFEGRSLGMGGVAVATADLATAAWANPAMLTNQRTSDDFSLLIGLGAMLRDSDDLVTDIDDFQAADDRRNAAVNASNVPEAEAAILDMAKIISGIDGKNIAADVTLAIAMGASFESFATALSIRADAIGAGTVTDFSTSAADVTDLSKNILNLEGVVATEFGLSLAKDFQMMERRVSIGIKPKIVDLQAFSYRESILTIDTTDKITNKDNKTDLGTFTTIDLGASVDLSDKFRLGLLVRNLLTDKFDVNLSGANGTPFKGTLNFDTEARLGLAYHTDFLTVGVDYDLTANQPLLANPAFDSLKTQYLAAGVELNVFDYMQLRLGAAKNIASGISDSAKDTAITAGLGFWLGFNLDIAATYTPNSVGAFLQTGFRF